MTTSILLNRRGRAILMLLFTLISSTIAHAQLTGTKNIPGDYATLGAAIADLNTNGVGAGGVVINVIAGNAQTAPTAAGTGSIAGAVGAGYVICVTTNAPTAANPVTIQGNGNTVTASALATASNYNDALFTIAGTSYITISNFILNDNASNTTVAASNNKTEIGVAIVRGNGTTLGSQYCTITGCTITLGQGAAYTNTIGIYSNSSNSYNTAYTNVTAATSSAGSMSNNSFYSNTISGVTCGMAIIGTAAYNDVGNIIGASGQGNTITLVARTSNMTMTTAYANYLKTRQDGIFTINNNSFFIDYNTITLPTGGTTNTPDYGIFSSTSASGSYTNTITNNTISLTTTTSSISLVGVQNGSGTSSSTVKINSNRITLTGTTGTNTGIGNSASLSLFNANNNKITQTTTTAQTISVFNSGTTVTSFTINSDTCTVTATTSTANYPIYNSSAATSAEIKNCIISDTSTSGVIIGINNVGSLATALIDGDSIVTRQGTVATTSYAILNTAGSATSFSITNNNVNMRTRSSGGTFCIGNTGKDSLLKINNNKILLQTNGNNTNIIGVYMAAANEPKTLEINGNTIDISTSANTTSGLYYIYSTPTNANPVGLTTDINSNIFKSTNGISTIGGTMFLILDQWANKINRVKYNTVSGTITKAGGATRVYAIDCQAAGALNAYNVDSIAFNHIKNITLGSNDTFYGIYNATSTAQNRVICYDTISNIVGGSGATQGIVVDYCPETSQFLYNIVGSLDGGPTNGLSGTGDVTGMSTQFRIANVSTGSYGGTYRGNRITGLASSGASGRVYGILNASSATPGNNYSYYEDTVANLSVSGSTAPVIYGIYQNGGNTKSTYNNYIHDFTTTSGGAANATIFGIYATGTAATTSTIYGNTINSLSAGNSAGASTQVNGIYLPSATFTYNVYNNFISSLGAPSANNYDAVVGINMTTTGSIWNVHYNTIYLPSLSGGANFGAAGILFPSGSTKLTLKNNIVNMATSSSLSGTGIASCLRRNVSGTGGVAPTTSNYDGNYNIFHVNTDTRNYFYAEQTAGGSVTNGYNITTDPSFNECAGLYKAYMGSGRESQTYTENNLSASGITGNYAPTSASYAYQSGVAITSPSITTDWSGATRVSTPSRGALEFAGSAPSAGAPPVITYTALNSISYCTSVTPVLTATITSGSGIDTTAGTKPRLYYKGNADTDAYGGANNSSFDGWKYVEASNTSSPFTFAPDYSLLYNTPGTGTVISYFVIAQDTAGTPVIGYNQVGFAGGYCPASVAVTAGAAPTAALPTVNSYTITAVPAFTSSVSQGFFCSTNNNATLTVTPSPSDLGIQWQQDFGTGGFSAISGGTSNGYSATPPAPPYIASPADTNVYRAILTCNGSTVATSSTTSVTNYSPEVLTTTAAERCGTGSVTLAATGSAGSTLNWYAASTGGLPLGTGVSYPTPSISSTTTFYVADSFGSYGGVQTVGQTSPGGVTFFTPFTGGFSTAGTYFTVHKPLTIKSVDLYNYYSGYSFTIGVYNTLGTLMGSYSGTTTGSAGTVAQTVPINIYLDSGTYQMAFTSATYTSFYPGGSSTGFSFPYASTPSIISLTSSTYGPYYFFFYNWQVTAGCISTRTPVTATINSLPDAGTVSGSPTTLCTGSSLTLSETGTPSGSGTMTSYSWTGPNSYSNTAAAASVSPAVFSPTTTAASGYYSLTVTYPGTGCTSNPVQTSYITVNSVSTPTITGTTNVCVAYSTTLSATPVDGTWSSADPSIASVDPTTGVVTGVLAGATTITYTSPCGAYTTTSYTVNTTPDAIVGTSTICTLSNTTLTNTVGGGTWTSGTPSVATINSSTGYVGSLASSGVTTITYAISSCSVNFVLTVGTAAPAAITGNLNACAAGDTTLLTSATGGGVWSSTSTSIATITSGTGIVYGVSSGTSIITYSTGCGIDTAIMNVNGTTVSTTNSGPTCTGTTLTLTGTVGTAGTYSWTGPNGFTSTLLSPTVSSATSATSGTYSLAVTSGGCITSASTFAVVDTLPNASANISAPIICPGGSSVLTGTVSSPTTLSVISVPYSLISFTPTGTLTSGSGWSSDNNDGSINVSIPFNFTFYNNSYSSVNISANGYINFGTAITSGHYTAATIPSAAAGVPKNMIALFWHDMKVTSGSVTYGTTGSAPNRKFIIAYNAIPDGGTSQTNSGQIILYETSNNIDLMITRTTTAYAMTTGIQNSTGTSALTPPGKNNASFSVTGANEGWRFETPSYTYTWSPATALSNTAVYNPTTTATSTTTYTVTAADIYSGCTGDTAQSTITVNAAPTISGVTPSVSNLCVGGSSVLTAGTLSGGTGSFVSYVWSGSDGYTNTIMSEGTTTVTVTPTTTATYSVIANYSVSGCSTSPATTSVTAHDQPSFTSVTASDASLCPGDTVAINAVVAGGTGSATYTWSGAAISTSTGATGTSPTYTPTLSGTSAYSVTVAFTGEGCNDTASSVNVTLNPTPSITPGGDPTVCEGTSTTSLSYSGASGSPSHYSITWGTAALAEGFSHVSLNPLVGSISINLPDTAVAGVYTGTLTVTNAASCTSSEYPISVTVLGYPTLNITSAVAPCVGNATTIEFTGTSGAEISYMIDSGSITNATLTGGVYSLNTGALSIPHTYTIVDVHNILCVTPVDTVITITPITMQWVGGASGAETDWNTAANWSCGIEPDSTDDVTIPFGTTYAPAIVSSGTGYVKSLTVNSGAAMSIGPSGTLHVASNITANGSVTGSGKIVMDGTTAQTIYGNGTFTNLEINNATGAAINAGDKATIISALTVTSGTLNTNDSLVLYSDSDATARIAPSAGTITGEVRVMQYIPGGRRAFRFWSHPFSSYIAINQMQQYIDITGTGGATNGFTTTGSNAPSAFRYDPNMANSSLGSDPGWRPFTSTYSTADSNRLYPHQGIRMFVRGAKGEGLSYATYYTVSPVTITMHGPVNQGAQVVSLVKGAGANQDFNMVGNPYASPVDIGTVAHNAKVSGNMTGGAIYVWNPYVGVSGYFQSVPVSTVSATPYYLQTNTSFQLRAGHDGDSLVFAESNKNATASTTLLKALPQYVSLFVYDASYHPWDNLFVRFDASNVDEDDNNEDAVKATNPDLNFYSLSADKHKMSIDVRPFRADKVIPLGIATSYAQEYIIKSESVAVPDGGKVYLHDKLLNKYVLLQLGTEYRFSIDKDGNTQGDDRFELSMNPAQLPQVANAAALKVSMTPNPATDDVHISFSSGKTGNVAVTVTDLSGVAIFTKDLGAMKNGTVSVPLTNLASGIYLVELTHGDQKVIERLVKD